MIIHIEMDFGYKTSDRGCLKSNQRCIVFRKQSKMEYTDYKMLHKEIRFTLQK